MRILIGALVVIVGLLHMLNEQLATYEAPKVSVVPPVHVPVSMPQDPVILPPVIAEVPGRVSDAERFQLAVAAGWTRDEAIIATAIAIAENGSGNPAALSGTNFDGSRDLGLWQINSGWWPQFGGHDALIVPINNARAGYVIYKRQGWCAWSTYGTPSTCYGIAGHNNAYAAFLERARAAAR